MNQKSNLPQGTVYFLSIVFLVSSFSFPFQTSRASSPQQKQKAPNASKNNIRPTAQSKAKPQQATARWPINHDTLDYDSGANARKFAPEHLTQNHYLHFVDPVFVNAWQEKDMPIVVQFKPADKVKGFTPKMIEVFKECCLQWTEATNNRVQFEFGLRAEPGNGITVEFTDDRSAIDNITSGLTETAQDQGGIFNARIFIYTKDSQRADYSFVTLKKTMLHEIGHALGIHGHSPHGDDVMATGDYSRYIYPDTPLEQVRLSKRDCNTINYIYDNAETLFSRAKAKVESELYDPENFQKDLRELASTYDGPDVRHAIAALKKRFERDHPLSNVYRTTEKKAPAPLRGPTKAKTRP